MTELSSESGMRFNKFNFRSGGVRLEWMSDDEQQKNRLAYWDFHGKGGEEECEQKLFEISKVTNLENNFYMPTNQRVKQNTNL